MNETPTLSDRIETLTPRLRQIATQFSQDPLQADDIYQHMVECILRDARPTDSNSRILTLAQWRARNYIQKEKVYSNYVSNQEVLGGPGDEGDNDQDDPFDSFKGPGPSAHNIEDVIIEREISEYLKELLDRLPFENQRIVSLLATGEKPATIAWKLDVSPSAICQRMHTIRKWLQKEGFGKPETETGICP